MNAAFLLCSDKPDGKGLYNWDKCHVGIGGNCNGADIFGIQDLGYQNGSRSVGSTDDSDRSSVF